jgi:predicted RNA-binding Zn-ribbon protein involved in translation (DUF1610 family)
LIHFRELVQDRVLCFEMPNTVTCHCGQRITVGPKPGRETVDCPACGESVRLNGAPAEAPPLKFGVKVVERPKLEPAARMATIAFSCPGCGKEFEESSRAAGKPTRCPKCGTEFVIPADGSGVIPSTPQPAKTEQPVKADELRSLTLPARPVVPPKPQFAEAGVEAAVAAYNAGKPGGAKRRMITGGRMVPIGFCLILLGGGVSILGSVLLVKGSLSAFSTSALGGGLGGGGGLIGPMADYSKLLRELAAEPGAKRRGQAPPQQPLNGLPVGDAGQAAKDYQKSLNEQQEQQSSGQTMLIGGVIASGVGMLITFIGGIFLLAGLIGRFLQPQQPAVPPVKAGEPGA